MKKKNGFTLIELLAVIVILAIIALIAVPQILKILNKARKSAAEDTTYGIVNAAENYATNFMLENNGTMPNESLEFECDGKSCNLKTKLTGYNLIGLDKLDFKGTKPTSGTITISNNGENIVATKLSINGFNCNYANDNASCTSGSSSETNPSIPSLTGPTSEVPTGDGYTGVEKIIYLDPTDLTKSCDASNINSDTGTKTGCMKWYAYNDDGTNYTMILDHNTTATIEWASREDYIDAGGTATDYVNKGSDKGAVTANKQLASDTIKWDKNLRSRLIRADEIATIVGKNEWANNYSNYFNFDTGIIYGWLFDRTGPGCTSYGCLNNATGTSGYWTDSSVSNKYFYAWRVSFKGELSSNTVSITANYGVRPVITVEKSKIS